MLKRSLFVALAFCLFSISFGIHAEGERLATVDLNQGIGAKSNEIYLNAGNTVKLEVQNGLGSAYMLHYYLMKKGSDDSIVDGFLARGDRVTKEMSVNEDGEYYVWIACKIPKRSCWIGRCEGQATLMNTTR